jgi:hypothetical protein
MKYKLFLLVPCYFLLINYTIGQSSKTLFTDISNYSCNCIEFLDTENRDKQQISSCIQDAYSKYQEQIINEMTTYINTNTNKTEDDAKKHIQKNLTKYLINDCPSFYNYTIKEAAQKSNLISKKASSEFIENSSKKICDCIDEINPLTQIQIDECIIKSIDFNSKEFQDELEKNNSLITNLTAFLMGFCEKYSKFAVNEKFKKK